MNYIKNKKGNIELVGSLLLVGLVFIIVIIMHVGTLYAEDEKVETIELNTFDFNNKEKEDIYLISSKENNITNYYYNKKINNNKTEIESIPEDKVSINEISKKEKAYIEIYKTHGDIYLLGYDYRYEVYIPKGSIMNENSSEKVGKEN